MLEPRDRQLMFDALRPPLGYRFDQGIGTTYSMDLVAMLLAPVAFTFFDQYKGEEGPAPSSLEVLESLRRHAGRMTVFCESARISVPKGKYPHLAFIEESVLQCRPPDGGSFHPKLWVLRFLGEGPTRYRVLCLTRNLMFCRAWDTMLTLDGAVGTRGGGDDVKGKDRLAEFLRALPQFTKNPAQEVIARAELFATEIQATKFELPPDVSSARFWPLGTTARRLKPLQDIGKRLLIVSPFVALTALETLGSDTTECMVVSTSPQLGALSRRPKGISRFFVLNERAITEAEDSAAMSEALSEPMADAIAQEDLHAKLYVTEFGAEAHVWTGSANATSAALDRNIEFVVEFTGHRKRFGIDALMTPEKGEVRFINLIKDVTGEAFVGAAQLDPAEDLRRDLEAARCMLRDALLEAIANDGADGSYKFSLVCRGDSGIVVPDHLTAFCWPVSTVSAKREFRICQTGDPLVEFPHTSIEALTTFFAFELAGRANGQDCRLAFVLNVPLTGGPTDRKERVLHSFLKNRTLFLKFLMLLLADEGFDPTLGGELLNTDNDTSAGSHAPAAGLFEMMLRALDTSPVRLDHLHSLLKQVTADAEGQKLLPPGFADVWEPIWAEREAQRKAEAVI
jgi:hypothetical protein